MYKKTIGASAVYPQHIYPYTFLIKYIIMYVCILDSRFYSKPILLTWESEELMDYAAEYRMWKPLSISIRMCFCSEVLKVSPM